MKISKILCNKPNSSIFSNNNFHNTFIKKYSQGKNNFYKFSAFSNKINNTHNFFSIQKFLFSKRIFEQKQFNEITSKENVHVKLIKNTTSSSETKTEAKEQSTKITSKLLCELIGCKHYPSNEEINIDEEILVNVYDESDKFLGKQSFGEAFKHATEIGKDIILRNDKVVPPVVKIMKYRVELVKRLMKKLGKTVESEKKENLKYMTFSHNISENDFNNKLSKVKELLAHFSYIRVVIPCDINNVENTLKSTSLLNNLTNDLSEFCKVKSGPIRQKQKKQKFESVDAKLTDSIQKHEKQDKEIKEAYEISVITDIKNDKDLDYISCVYIDYESLLLDSTGVNYDKLLESINLDNLVKGITKTNIVSKTDFETKDKTILGEEDESVQNEKSSRNEFYQKLAQGLKETPLKVEGDNDIIGQIEALEKEIFDQKDLRKRFLIMKKLTQLKTELEINKIKIANKTVKKKILAIVKQSAIKRGVLNLQEQK